MKIAFASEDGRNISPHFGRAEFFVILDLENGVESSRRLIGKESTRCNCDHKHDEHEHKHEHKNGGHKAIFEPLVGCEVVIGGGMGSGALNRLKAMDIEVLLTDHKEIETALKDFIDGKLVHIEKRAH